MPTALISTHADDEGTTPGAYSLCFPYYFAEKNDYAMQMINDKRAKEKKR